MKKPFEPNHPLRAFFRSEISDVFDSRLQAGLPDDVEDYLAEMLAAFVSHDAIFGLRDATGRPVESLAEMLVEGDVRMRAPNFEREREVHRHIGDFLLFWSGLFPEALNRIPGFYSPNKEEEAVRQGRQSYEIVSSFDHAPYTLEATTFRNLSESFETCRLGLRVMRASFEGFKLQGWEDGFRA